MTEKNHNNLIIIGSLAIAAVLIVLLLPRSEYKGFRYSKGSVWNNKKVLAEMQVDVPLDSATQRHIEDSIQNVYRPVFQRDFVTERTMLKEIGAALDSQAYVKAPTRKLILDHVSDIFAHGIVSNAMAEEINSGDLNYVRMPSAENSNTYQEVSTAYMMSSIAAYAYLDTTLVDAATQNAMDDISINRYLQPNIVYDSATNRKLLDDLRLTELAKASPPPILEGAKIVDQGDKITDKVDSQLKAYDQAMRAREAKQSRFNSRFCGQIIFVVVMLIVFYVFMRVIRPRSFAILRKMEFLIIFTTAFILVVELVLRFKPNYVYVIPFALLPIILTTFSDTRTSFFIHVVAMLICSLSVQNATEFIIMQFLAGDIAILSIKELTRRSQLLACAGFIFLSYCLSYTAVSLINGISLRDLFLSTAESVFDWQVFLMFFINCAVLSLAYLLIFIIEKLYGFTSSVTLVELSDINNPELRTLSLKCPGTFQHSLQVANLAGEAAHAIEANVQLVRAGALYHDIGKINNAAFFTENNPGTNPHDMLTPEQSAQIVIRHVTDGVERASKAKLPRVIKDFILQHHGKGVTKYFYLMACKASPTGTVDPAPYTYPGPNPQTKEAAIVMMADACEAACKSLKNPTKEEIANLVEKIIRGQIAAGLLNEARINFQQVSTVIKIFTNRIQSMYYTRIEYPEDIQPIQPAEEEPLVQED